jgi:hypothetical protein
MGGNVLHRLLAPAVTAHPMYGPTDAASATRPHSGSRGAAVG